MNGPALRAATIRVTRSPSQAWSSATRSRRRSAQDARTPAAVRPIARRGRRSTARLDHVGVAHQRVLELDGADPLAARLDDVLGAVGDLHVALGRRSCRRRRCAASRRGTSPARPRRVAGRDPRAAHLELADGVAVPGQLGPVLVDDAQLHAGSGAAALGAPRRPPPRAAVPRGRVGDGGRRARSPSCPSPGGWGRRGGAHRLDQARGHGCAAAQARRAASSGRRAASRPVRGGRL